MHSTSVLAWNALGHRIIAQIAFDQLSTAKKRELAHVNQVLNKQHKPLSLVNASVWMDRLYGSDVASLKTMHYIDMAFAQDGTVLPPLSRINVVWAIKMASFVLSDPHASNLDKAIALRILLHAVGDVHQPLHAATMISSKYPSGDKGGNLFLLSKNPIAPNLHAYWDKGGGLLVGQRTYKQAQVKQIARSLERQYPCNPATLDRNPMHWAKESHAIAVTHAYALPKNHYPYNQYQQMTQQICVQRLALAGCRLAALLNH